MFFLLSHAFTPLISIHIEDRDRFERHTAPPFSSIYPLHTSDLLSRLRVGADFAINANWSAKAEYQNSYDLYWSAKKNGGIQNSDASLAYVAYKEDAFSAAAGRQKVILNAQRLIGPAEWLNMGRSFDALRADYKQWEIWGGAIGVANVEPRTARVGALTYNSTSWGTPSVILKHDVGTPSDVDEQTYDYYVLKPVGGFTLDGEGALQFGNNDGKNQQAWAAHARAKHAVLPKTTLSLEGNVASGGSTSHVNRTFDNLYPSNHDLYGLADTTAWKNMEHAQLCLESKPCPNATIKADYNWFSLQDPRDAWYGYAGTANIFPGGTFKDSTGMSGRFLGREFDLVGTYQTKHAGSVSAGLALFEPGSFVRNVSGQGRQQTFAYLQYQIRL